MARAGELRTLVALQSKAQTPTGGASGTGLTDTYTTVADVWARIDGLQGGRYVAGQQVEETATHKITIRYRSDYTSAWRFILDGARRFELKTVRDPDGLRKFLEIWAQELKPNV